MLQAIRSRAASLVVKILFALLILSFGGWGIGDIFRGKDQETAVARVGTAKIEAADLNLAVQTQMNKMRGLFGGSIDMEQARQLGIIDSALNDLIDRKLVDLEVQRLGLAVGRDTVRNVILTEPAFRDSAGNFSRATYGQVLAANRLTDTQYEAMLRLDIDRGHLAQAVMEGGSAPRELAQALYRSRNEKRVAETVFLPAASAGDIGTPTDEDLKEYHDQHSDDFRAPEYRTFTVGVLHPDDLSAGVTVPEQKLKAEYQARLSQYETPERRKLQQILVSDEAKTKEIEAQLAQGKDFLDVAKAVANQSADAVDLGWVQHEDMPEQIAEAVFSLKENEVSQPVQSPLGWHILKVTAIEAAATKSLDEVKAQLTADIARDEAIDDIARTANSVDDALAGGTSFDDIAEKFKFKKTTLTGVTTEGRDEKGAIVQVPPPGKEILKTAFITDQGQMSQFTESQDGSYYLVRVEKVTPAAIKPLETVKPQVLAGWQRERRDELLSKQAKELAAAATDGKTLKDVAAAKNLTLGTTPPFGRTGSDALPATVIARLFEAKPGAVVTAPASDGYYVAQVIDAKPADPTADPAAVETLAKQLDGSVQADLMTQFGQALRQRYSVSIDRVAVDRQFQ